MKEFYLKKNNKNEILFFFRNYNKNKISKNEWIRKIDENSENENSADSFKKLLKFLDIKNKIIHKLDDVLITIWRGNEYKITKIEMGNNEKIINNTKFSIAEDNYICSENEIYIINKNNNINERLL